MNFIEENKKCPHCDNTLSLYMNLECQTLPNINNADLSKNILFKCSSVIDKIFTFKVDYKSIDPNGLHIMCNVSEDKIILTHNSHIFNPLADNSPVYFFYLCDTKSIHLNLDVPRIKKKLPYSKANEFFINPIAENGNYYKSSSHKVLSNSSIIFKPEDDLYFQEIISFVKNKNDGKLYYIIKQSKTNTYFYWYELPNDKKDDLDFDPKTNELKFDYIDINYKNKDEVINKIEALAIFS